MEYFILAYVFVLGTILGSFYNVCIYRIPAGKSIINPPSHCTSCENKLKAVDLIPILSYIFLKGRCRYCGEKISPRYALVEFFTGVIFAGVYIKYGLGIEMIKYEILSSFMIIVGLIDYDTTDVYSIITYLGLGIGIVFVILEAINGYNYRSYIYGMLLAGGVIAAIVFITRAMGTGDIEICALAGLYLGFQKSLVMLFFSFVIGGAAGAVIMVVKGKDKKDYIAFGPYIALAAIVAMLFGTKIISIYLGTL